MDRPVINLLKNIITLFINIVFYISFSGFFHLMPTILTNIYNSVRTPILFQAGTIVFHQIPFLNVLYAGLFIVLLPLVYKSYRKYGLKKKIIS